MMKISLTGVSVASRDLNVISNNLANAMTTGFKRSISQINDFVASSQSGRPDIEVGQGALTQEVRRSLQQGALQQTDNKMDLALSGAGYFTFGDAATTGDMAYKYSRAGKLSLDATGAITDQGGSPLLGLPVMSGGVIGMTPQPINVSSAVGGDLTKIQSISIDTHGVVSVQSVDGRTTKVAALAIANFRNEQGLKSIGGAQLTETDNSGAPEYSQAGRNGMGEIKQGTLETSNVDMTGEMLRMIQAQQAYNGNARALQTTSEMLRSTIETLTR